MGGGILLLLKRFLCLEVVLYGISQRFLRAPNSNINNKSNFGLIIPHLTNSDSLSISTDREQPMLWQRSLIKSLISRVILIPFFMIIYYRPHLERNLLYGSIMMKFSRFSPSDLYRAPLRRLHSVKIDRKYIGL